MPPSGPGVDVLDFRGGGNRWFPRALRVSHAHKIARALSLHCDDVVDERARKEDEGVSLV
jgi:hypothetical protein